MPRVLLIDDHRAILAMMRNAVESLEGYSVAGEATTSQAAIDVCRQSRPDLIVLDLALGSESGLDLFSGFRSISPGAKIIVFSGVLRPPAIKRALAAGAHGLIEKTASLDEFHSALRTVASGAIYFSGFASDQIRQLVHRRGVGRNGVVQLTERDKQLLQAVAEGLSSKEISERLGLSPHAVATRRARLMRKTGLKGVAQLARYAVNLGLVSEVVEGAAEAI
jgi:DNA-binding NarL/FixJ family response regulator